MYSRTIRKIFSPAAFFCMLISLFSVHAYAYTFTEGVDYVKLEKPVDSDKGKVIQFFSYECRYCFRAEPAIREFVRQKPKNIQFEVVPVTLGMLKREAVSYARFLAIDLGVLEKFHDYMLTIIHISLDDEKKTYNKLANLEDVKKFFVDHGVDPKKFDASLAKIKASGVLEKADKKASSYKVAGTPTFIINGKYRVNGYKGGIDGEKKFTELLLYLTGL